MLCPHAPDLMTSRQTRKSAEEPQSAKEILLINDVFEERTDLCAFDGALSH